MSPIEVGSAIQTALRRGATIKECATELHFAGTGHIGRFIRILDLPSDLQHLVDWGAENGTISFTAATELVSLGNETDQRTVANAILAKGLTSKEVRQVAQLRRRTKRQIESCISEALGMRTVVDRRYVFLGSVGQACGAKLTEMSQANRNRLITAATEELGIVSAVGRLGAEFFTLVGGEEFHTEMKRIGKQRLEQKVRSIICGKEPRS